MGKGNGKKESKKLTKKELKAANHLKLMQGKATHGTGQVQPTANTFQKPTAQQDPNKKAA